jgi:ribosomal protein S14
MALMVYPDAKKASTARAGMKPFAMARIRFREVVQEKVGCLER